MDVNDNNTLDLTLSLRFSKIHENPLLLSGNNNHDSPVTTTRYSTSTSWTPGLLHHCTSLTFLLLGRVLFLLIMWVLILSLVLNLLFVVQNRATTLDKRK